MPEKIKLEDGTEREVPTQEELEELQKKAEAANNTQELEEKMKEQEKELEELRNQPGAEGIKNLRSALKRTKDALKAAGKEVDDDGNVIEQPPSITPEQIEETAQKTYNKQRVQETLAQKVKHLDKDAKEVFDKEFKELTEGRDVTLDTVDKWVNAAMAAGGLNQSSQEDTSNKPNLDTIHGSAPQPPKQEQVDKQRGVDLAQQMGYKFNSKDPNELINK